MIKLKKMNIQETIDSALKYSIQKLKEGDGRKHSTIAMLQAMKVAISLDSGYVKGFLRIIVDELDEKEGSSTTAP